MISKLKYAADSCADAPMHVRHRRHPLVDEGQLRDGEKLLACGVFERDAFGPGLDGHDVRGLDRKLCQSQTFLSF